MTRCGSPLGACVTNQGCPPFQVFSVQTSAQIRAGVSTEEMFLKSVKFSREGEKKRKKSSAR